MWYHIYIMYFLFAVVFALVILTMLLTKDTTIRVVYTKTPERDPTNIPDKFTTGTPSIIIQNLEMVAGDELVIGVSPFQPATTFNVTFILGDSTTATTEYDKVTSTQTTALVKLRAPNSRDDYALRFTGGTTAELEFVEVHSSTGLF